MISRKLMLVLLVATVIVIKSRGQETILENAANEFIIGFSTADELESSLILFVTTPETNPVTFTVTANGFSFTGTAFNNSSTEVSIPSTFQVKSNSERNKGIYVKAEGENKIVVYGLSYHMYTSDAFLALPCSNLAVEEYEYYAMTYPDRRPEFTSDVLIVGCEDNTLVTTPSNTITLNRLETYLIKSSDSTGMRITSTKPISFFSNQECSDIPTYSRSACDHLTEQLPPTSTWGTSFYAASLLGRNSGELFRIIIAKDSTTVTVNCTTFSQVQVYNLYVAGNWQEFQICPLSFCTIESSSPILVIQFALGFELDSIGDPFMMMIPPVEQYSNNYVFKALSSFSTNYITIYVATEYYQPNRIFVDDTSQVVSSWTSVYCSNGLLCGYITRVSLTAGEHRVYHQDSHARIGVSAYGFSRGNSYGYPGGLKQALSGPVSDLRTYSPDNFTLVISWSPPATPNGDILSYTVTIESLRDGTTFSDIVDPSAVTTNLTVNGLVPGVPYRVSVVAVNRAGQGNITTLTNFTKELEPTRAPKIIKVDRIHPTVMVVSWNHLTLSEARGFITSYTVFYSPQVGRGNQQEPNTMQKTVSGDVNRTTIHDLDPNIAYDVQMLANTKAGVSTLSEVISSSVFPDTGDGGLLIVIVVALVVILVLIFIIILLVLLVLRMQRTVKTRNEELDELHTYNYADQSDKEQDERIDETLISNYHRHD